MKLVQWLKNQIVLVCIMIENLPIHCRDEILVVDKHENGSIIWYLTI